MTSIFIRCDLSDIGGAGHLKRCLYLAKCLRQRSAYIHFILSTTEHPALECLKQDAFDFSFIELHNSNKSFNPIHPEDAIYCNEYQEKDASAFFEIISSSQLNKKVWIILDHYSLTCTWEKHLRHLACEFDPEINISILVLDDLGNRPLDSDILINAGHTINSQDILYSSLVTPKTRVLLGPSYALLDPIYAELSLFKKRPRTIQRVLIYFGGSDRFSYALRILNLAITSFSKDIIFEVVINQCSIDFSAITTQFQDFDNINIYSDISSLAPLLSSVDGCVVSGGHVVWEALSLSLPSLVICTSKNQLLQASLLASSSLFTCILQSDPIEDAELASSVTDFLHSQVDNTPLSPLVGFDANGAKRVATLMLTPQSPLHIREALASDMDLLFHWVNDAEVRENSFSSKPIDYDQHTKWFIKKQNSSNSKIFILSDNTGFPLGQIRADRFAQDNIPSASSYTEFAVLDYSLDKAFRGLGLGAKLFELGLEKIYQTWPGIILIAHVKDCNSSSIALLKAQKFLLTGDYKVSGSSSWKLLPPPASF